MMRWLGFALLATATLSSCDFPTTPLTLPVETEFALINLSPRWYATVGLRPSAAPGIPETEYIQSDLIPPWAVYRERFRTLFPQTGGCPDRLDLRVYLYKRVNEDVPVDIDPGEEVDPRAVASGEASILACGTVVAGTFTIVVLETTEGMGAVRVGEGTAAEDVVIFEGRALPDLEVVPARLASAPLSGRVVTPEGTPVDEIGVLLRPPPTIDDRVRCPDAPVGVCIGAPISFTKTDSEGRFAFDRPPGTYQVEVFADGMLFRPGFLVVASPIDDILFFAEPEP